MTRRQRMNSAVTQITMPNNDARKKRMSYLDEYSCKPPPIFLLTISLTQVVVFFVEVYELSKLGVTVSVDGPVFTQSLLILDPSRRYETWRLLSYMLVHAGYFHLIFNVLIQLVLGLPLEMVHRWWRILFIYISGVLFGSLTVSLTDPDSYLAGGSGGVYSIITAHLANVITNWSEMEFPGIRLAIFIILAGSDFGVAIYYRYLGVQTKISYVAHIAGALVGLVLGLAVLRNLKEQVWEAWLFWICIAVYLLTLFILVILNLIYLDGVK